jgi:hypothetical protein
MKQYFDDMGTISTFMDTYNTKVQYPENTAGVV